MIEKLLLIKKSLNVLQHFVLFKLNSESKIEDPSDILKDLNRKLKSFLSHVIEKYRKDCCKFEQFLHQTSNSEFLQNDFSIPASLLQFSQVLSGDDSPIKVSAPKRHKAGRKQVPFVQKSVRAQQYASAKIRGEHEPDAIIKAASQQPTTLGKLVRRSNSFKG